MGRVFRVGNFGAARPFRKMFSLTAREQTLLIVVLTATLLGAAAKHWREARRERPAASAPIVPGKNSPTGRATARRTTPRTVNPPGSSPEAALAEESAGH